MPKQEKLDAVSEYKGLIEESDAVILSDYQGLTVDQMNRLRRLLREKSVRYLIAKNTLLKIAADSFGGDYENLEPYWKGPTAVAFSKGDPTVGARAIYDFAKEIKKENKDLGKPDLKAGIVDGILYDKSMIDQLAQLPGRDELIAKVVGSISAPLSELVGTLDGVIREFVVTIDAIAAAKN
jgi:large subunit ribosomal protein L10